ncbi:uncharacterized protein A4U43_C01F32530 [Asparagus officinalis]|uniref:ERCC3/RAD25/XPB helicase C-terminal domain-containing protein n=1 Tax=Asparagus officinalis TaxID=4686 RepID=A0A5P1FVI4_ASPOF|nr:uncharacterized protein A4U43_C01F32530 [Asparagus officinalis]
MQVEATSDVLLNRAITNINHYSKLGLAVGGRDTRENGQMRYLLSIGPNALLGINPNKLRACEYLVDHNEKQGRKIVVCSDQLYVLALYSKKLKKPSIIVDTSKWERTYILREFRHGEKVDTIFVSEFRHGEKVDTIFVSEIDYFNADVEADVVIQLCYEELIAVNAQPLGLLLGGKATSGDGGLNPLYFYFLVSDDVKQEIDWFDKLKEFYVHQGYAFEQAEDLPPKNYFNLSFETEESNLSFCKMCSVFLCIFWRPKILVIVRFF